MATPYKRVKVLKKLAGGLGVHAVGAEIDLPSEAAEPLVTKGDVKLLGAGSPPKDTAAAKDPAGDK